MSLPAPCGRARPAKGLAPDVARLVYTGLLTGCRRGELLALKWDDCRSGELHVTRSVFKRAEKPTKSEEPRLVPVSDELAAILDGQRRWLLQTQHPGLASALVFPASPRHARAGATRREVAQPSWYRSPSVLDRPLRRICQAAGIPEVSAHALRRNYENVLRRCGVDSVVRRDIAGWRSEKVQDIYGRVDANERRAAAQSMARLVLGVPPVCTPSPETTNAQSAALPTGRLT
jgi:integrase